MPKIKSSVSQHLRILIYEFGSEVFFTDAKILFCKICYSKVTAAKRFTVQQYITRKKHKSGIDRHNAKNNSLFKLVLHQQRNIFTLGKKLSGQTYIKL